MDAQQKLNILLVDDSAQKLLTYELILANVGENLISARSADEALTQLLRQEIALLILDVNMPEVDGFQLADMIREHPRFCEIPIIFVSAVHMTARDRMKGYERGAVDYITAPIDAELLRARVNVFLRLHRTSKSLQETNAELRQMSHRLLRAQDAERRRIARDLHDSVGQVLAAAKIALDITAESSGTTEMLNEARSAVETAMKQIRSISYLLHPPLLDEIGLGPALKGYIEGLGNRCPIKISFEVEPQSFPRLRPEIETAVFRIIQESLTNVIRHSEAKKAHVSLAVQKDRLLASVRDDGKGLPIGAVELQPRYVGVGMSGMLQRAKELGGSVRFANGNSGTIVELGIPLEPATPVKTSIAASAA